MTLPLLPGDWSGLPAEQRRQWAQLQRQHAHYEWRRAERLQHRGLAASRPARRGGRARVAILVGLLAVLAVAVLLAIG